VLPTSRRSPVPLEPPVPLDPPALPERPCLVAGREAVSRAADAVQFGVDAPHALVLDGLTPPLVRMVAGLDGSRRVAEVVADAVAAGAGASDAHAVLRRLGGAGVLAACSVATPRPEVRVHGGGRVAVALACLLAGSRACRVTTVATGLVAVEDVGTGLAADDVGRSRSDAVAAAVARAAGVPGPPAAGTARPAATDLVVLADGPVPDPALLRAVAGPHLAVAVRDGVGVVGPLVLPGRTPCLGCDDRARAAADPAWPAVAAQLGRCRPAVAPALAGATAALAAEQVLAALRVGEPAPPVLGAVLELDPRAGSLRRRARAWHPACGCARAGRGPAALAA
jgi:hypothetical protein